MKFEGKTFYLYVSQKEVSAFPSRGTSRAQPWSLLQQVLHELGRLQPAAASPRAWRCRGTGTAAGAAARRQRWVHLPAPAGALLWALEPADAGLASGCAVARALP